MAGNETTLTMKLKVQDDGSILLDKFSGKLAEMPKHIDSFGNSWIGVTAKIAAFTGSVYGAIRTINSFVKEAAEADKIQHQLGYTVQAVGYSWEYYKTQTDAWAKSIMKATRFTDEEALQTLNDMFLFTNNITKAQQAATMAMDLAVRKNMDLASATRYVGMGMTGNIQMLGRMLPEFRNLSDTLGENASMAEKAAYFMKIFQEKFGGTARADIETYSGKVKQFSNSWKELKESIGTDALPVLGKVFEWLTKIVDKMREQRELQREIGGFFGGWGKAPPGSPYMAISSKAIFGVEEGIPEPIKPEEIDPFVRKYGLTEAELAERMSRAKLSYQEWLEAYIKGTETEYTHLEETYVKVREGFFKLTQIPVRALGIPLEEYLRPTLITYENIQRELAAFGTTLGEDTLQVTQWDDTLKQNVTALTTTEKYVKAVKDAMDELLNTAELLATTRMQPGGPWTGAEFTYPTEDILTDWMVHPKTGKPVLVQRWKDEVNQMQSIFTEFSQNISSVWAENVKGFISRGESLGDSLKNIFMGIENTFASAIAKMIANWALFGSIRGAVSGTATGAGILGWLAKAVGISMWKEGGIVILVGVEAD